MSDSNATFSRRTLLKTTGAGVVGLSGVTGSAAADGDGGEGSSTEGSVKNATVISEASELRSMASEPEGSFVLGSDIDASGLGAAGDGFQPIQDFAGTLDGQGYEINGLTMNRENSNAGLFHNTTTDATIKNVGLVGVDIVGGTNVGALAGINRGTVERCYASGRVESSNRHIGGLAGRNEGTIRESFSTVLVAGGDETGGFVGENRATITDCYTTGEVRTPATANEVGGFVGNQENNATIETSYASVLLGGDDVGGFTGGKSYNASENGCYRDTEASGLDSTAGGATGLTTDQMTGSTASSSMSSLGFNQSWDTATGEYPTLATIDQQTQLDARVDRRKPRSVRLERMSGDGSAANPYVITQAEDLRAMAEDTIAFFQLANSVDAGGIGAAGSGFQPIEDFAGSFDGQSYAISNLTIDRGNSNAGLFHNTRASATVANVGLVDADILGDTNTGALAGINRGTVRQCYASGRVESSNRHIGGLAGRNQGTISESFSTVLVAGDDETGGFVGENRATITDCYTTGEVRTPATADEVGGFVGNQENNATIETSYASVLLGGDDVGGFTEEKSYDATENGCYWDAEASGLDSTAGGATGLTTDQMTGSTASSSMSSFGFNQSWETVNGAYPTLTAFDESTQMEARVDQRQPRSVRLSQMGGDGSAADPYMITQAEDLRAMAEDTIAFFELADDIDASGLGTAGNGFQPIQDFAGSLDGQSYEVSNLRVDRENSNAGLFHNTRASATVANVGLVNADILGDTNTGALAGINRGTVERCYASGRVESSNRHIGGLAGRNEGTISESFSTVLVAGDDETGGFVGENRATITDCYTTGEVRTPATADEVGGFVGNQEDNATIETSYASVLLGGDDVGGFTGEKSYDATENGCYWDAEASGLDDTRGSATGLTTDQMTGTNGVSFNLSDLDFSMTWNTASDAYPVLSQLSHQRQLALRTEEREPRSARLNRMSGDGSAANPYVITQAEDLRAMAEDTIAFFELATSLDASGIGAAGSGFQPVEDFAGSFDGQSYEISNLRVDRENSNAGLFHNTRASATVANVGLVDADILGDTNVGALAGINRGTVERCYASGRVESSNRHIGGLAGRNEGTIREAFSTVLVAGDDETGGFVGENRATITDCYATGEVQTAANADEVGGFVGNQGDSATIENAYAAVPLSGNDVGGFAGRASSYNAPIRNCYWDVEVSGLNDTDGNASGLTTDQMTGNAASFNFDGFDFQLTWQDPTGTSDYPWLQFEDDLGTSCPTVDGIQTTDLDGDGTCGDVNGDGSADMADVTRLHVNRNNPEVTDNASSFDFNGDGSFTAADLTALFRKFL